MKKLRHENLKRLIQLEFKNYNADLEVKQFDQAFKRLERIHILSQPFPYEHTIVHFKMLTLAVRTFRPFEIFIQFLFTVFSGKFSLMNIFPQGNSGRAKDILKGQMEIPPDLRGEMLKAKTINN